MKKVVAIGIFDGVHAGHQQIISTAKHLGEVTVITFDPHPTSVLAPERTPTQLLPLADRIKFLKQAGAKNVEVISFTKEFSQLTPDQFIEDILVGRFAAEHVVIGENFNFGYKGEGSPKYLSEVGPKYGFGLSIVKLQEDRGSSISSTRIRNLVIDGEIERANELLTRRFYLTGPVIHGEKRGRTIGYPTANIGLGHDATIPSDGVYAGWLYAGTERYPAALSVGVNATFQEVPRLIEAHILDRDDVDLYDKLVTLEYVDFIRPSAKFDGVESLVAEINRDLEKIRQRLDI